MFTTGRFWRVVLCTFLAGVIGSMLAVLPFLIITGAALADASALSTNQLLGNFLLMLLLLVLIYSACQALALRWLLRVFVEADVRWFILWIILLAASALPALAYVGASALLPSLTVIFAPLASIASLLLPAGVLTYRHTPHQSGSAAAHVAPPPTPPRQLVLAIAPDGDEPAAMTQLIARLRAADATAFAQEQWEPLLSLRAEAREFLNTPAGRAAQGPRAEALRQVAAAGSIAQMRTALDALN